MTPVRQNHNKIHSNTFCILAHTYVFNYHVRNYAPKLEHLSYTYQGYSESNYTSITRTKNYTANLKSSNFTQEFVSC